jgi:hypothetical protein
MTPEEREKKRIEEMLDHFNKMIEPVESWDINYTDVSMVDGSEITKTISNERHKIHAADKRR